MDKVKKRMGKLAAMMAVLGVAAAFGGAPAAMGDPPKFKCNSGNGNASETDPSNDCDPGNSGGHNNGGD